MNKSIYKNPKVLGMVFFALCLYGVTYVVGATSHACRHAIEVLKSNAVVQVQLGADVSVGLLPYGYRFSTTRAEFSLAARGKGGFKTYRVSMKSVGDRWDVSSLKDGDVDVLTRQMVE